MADERRPKPGEDPTPASSAPGAPRSPALSEGVLGPDRAGAAPGPAGQPGGTGSTPDRDVMPDTGSGDLSGRTADGEPSGGPGEAPRDAIDRAAEEETQAGGPGAHDPDGAAFPNPGGGAVVAPGGADREPADPATAHPEDGEGAGDALRGGGGGPLPPGTGRPLPDPDRDGSASVAPDATLRAADGPTALEAGPEGSMPAGPEAEAMHALGVEAGRNGWVLWVLGLAAIVAGVVAVAMPVIASLATNAVVASLLVISGAVGLFTAFRRRDGGAIAVAFALSVVSVVAGVVMLLAPLAGIVTLSMFIIAFFAASGAMRIWYGIKHAQMRGRGWLIASGALSVALAVVLWLAAPGTLLWLPGVLLGVDLIVYGTVMISLAVFGRPKLDLGQKA